MGPSINWLCNILTQSETQITCLTPPLPPRRVAQYQQYSSPVDILVTANLVDEAVTVCTGDC